MTTELRSGLILQRPDDSDIIHMWVLSVRHFDAARGERRTFLDDDRDPAALMRRARSFGCHDWAVWLDAPHAPGQLRLHAVGSDHRVYMLTQSVWNRAWT